MAPAIWGLAEVSHVSIEAGILACEPAWGVNTSLEGAGGRATVQLLGSWLSGSWRQGQLATSSHVNW